MIKRYNSPQTDCLSVYPLCVSKTLRFFIHVDWEIKTKHINEQSVQQNAVP